LKLYSFTIIKSNRYNLSALMAGPEKQREHGNGVPRKQLAGRKKPLSLGTRKIGGHLCPKK
jgi:hypothetical protein